jgi:hypothetical protein
MAKLLVIGGAVVVVIVAAVAIFFFMLPRPDVTEYEALKTPRIVSMPAQKMIEIVTRGVPNKVLQNVFSELFGAYFAIKDTPKGPDQSAPRLRCFLNENIDVAFTSDSESIDMQIGLPIPDSVTTLAGSTSAAEGKPRIGTWEYGDTAEILHIGPYDKETPTIKTLLDYIDKQGYAPVGIHEEEYVIGPGSFGVSPEKYYTVIRYPLKKK